MAAAEWHDRTECEFLGGRTRSCQARVVSTPCDATASRASSCERIDLWKKKRSTVGP